MIGKMAETTTNNPMHKANINQAPKNNICTPHSEEMAAIANHTFVDSGTERASCKAEFERSFQKLSSKLSYIGEVAKYYLSGSSVEADVFRDSNTEISDDDDSTRNPLSEKPECS